MAENPQTFRDQVMKEIWDERNGVQNSKPLVTSNMIGGIDSDLIGKEPDHLVLRDLVKKKRAELEILKVTMQKKAQKQKEQYERKMKE